MKWNGTIPSFAPPTSGFHLGILQQVACAGSAGDERSPIAKDVPVLWTDYAASRAALSGMRETAPSPTVRTERRTARVKEDSEEILMLWTIVAVLLILWLLGFSLHVAGGLIHLLLVVALIVVVVNLLSGRRAV